MLAGVHCGAGLFGIEVGHILNDRSLDSAFEQLLVAVQSHKPARLIHLQRLACLFGHVGEVIGDGVKTRSRHVC